MKKLSIMFLFCICVWWPSLSPATVIFGETFESFADGAGCAQLVTGAITQCRGTGTVGANTNLISIEDAIPGYAGSFPSGTKVMRGFVDAVDAQGDVGIKIGTGTDNYIPALSWLQVAIYINNAGGETTVTTGRPMKLFYPCHGVYPCGADGSSGYFILETARGDSYNPFNSTALSGDTGGDQWLAIRDNSAGTTNWAGAAGGGTPGSESTKLGQTNLSERLRAGRWNILKCKFDFTDTASGKVDCWIAPMGGAFTLVLSWHGGDTVQGSSFTWTLPEVRGHQFAWLPSTQPANNAIGARHYMYYDDYYIATSEADLPIYTAGPAPRFVPGFLKVAEVQP